MNIYYIFDIDGTITVPRKPMDEDFFETFYEFAKNNKVVLVTGSDKKLALEQIPEKLLSIVKLYTCSGVEGLENITVDYEINDPVLIQQLENMIDVYQYKDKTGSHVNKRKGMINFSVVGRNANDQQRKEYAEFDKVNNQRKNIVNKLSTFSNDYEICIGGEISIDITKKGINKSLVAKDILEIDPDAYLIFYGNQILDGNDYFLAKYIQENKLGYSIPIDYELLKELDFTLLYA